MRDFGIATFGELNADGYDEQHDPGTTDEAVELLWALAEGGKTLELAIGSGRLALPLSLRGLDVSGLEASPKMVDVLRDKTGGENIGVTVGDMADVEVGETYDFVFLAFNTLFNLRTQEQQIRCFANTANCLNPGGKFLVETYVPDLSMFTDGQSLRTKQVGFSSALIEAAIHNPVEQTVEYQRIRLTDKGIQTRPLPIRYAWPAEIDLMARLAGLRLVDRWGGWDRCAFTPASKMHVSLYEKQDGRTSGETR